MPTNLALNQPGTLILRQADADARYVLTTATDPFTFYYNQARGDARYAQLSAVDPYPQYFNQSRGDARYLQQSQTDSLYLKLSGGTLTGFLTLSADPTANLQAATKHYVDSQIAALQSQITANTNAISTLQSQVSANQSAITTLQGQVSSLNTRVTNLENATPSGPTQTVNLAPIYSQLANLEKTQNSQNLNIKKALSLGNYSLGLAKR